MGSLLVRIRLPVEQGHQLLAAIGAVVDAAADEQPEPGSAEPPEPLSARRLDALFGLVADATTTRTTLVVHVRADDEARIDGGPTIPTSTAARLTCTAPARALVIDRAGDPLYLGRTRRTVSPGPTARPCRAPGRRPGARCTRSPSQPGRSTTGRSPRTGAANHSTSISRSPRCCPD